ncbi:MAG: hypothetical protein KC800_11625 [Candidatus Eremiobacteraeota bacterium]|nr:hypothetical protein [Candidatus Eremiobacteraeota bacterium]
MSSRLVGLVVGVSELSSARLLTTFETLGLTWSLLSPLVLTWSEIDRAVSVELVLFVDEPEVAGFGAVGGFLGGEVLAPPAFPTAIS